MKKLKLNDVYLRKLMDLIKIDDSMVKKISMNVNVIQGDDSFFEDMLDNLSNYLIQYGLNENDEPNSFGLKIEDLIDKISEIYYDNIS